MDFLNHPAYEIAPAPVVANAIAVDFLRKMNVDARPEALKRIKEWREEVYDLIINTYPQHC